MSSFYIVLLTRPCISVPNRRNNLSCDLLRSLLYNLLRNLWSNLLRNLRYNLSCNLRNNLKLLSFYVQILLDDLGML